MLHCFLRKLAKKGTRMLNQGAAVEQCQLLELQLQLFVSKKMLDADDTVVAAVVFPNSSEQKQSSPVSGEEKHPPLVKNGKSLFKSLRVLNKRLLSPNKPNQTEINKLIEDVKTDLGNFDKELTSKYTKSSIYTEMYNAWSKKTSKAVNVEDLKFKSVVESLIVGVVHCVITNKKSLSQLTELARKHKLLDRIICTALDDIREYRNGSAHPKMRLACSDRKSESDDKESKANIAKVTEELFKVLVPDESHKVNK